MRPSRECQARVCALRGVIRDRSNPVDGIACSARAPVAGLLLGETPGLLGDLVIQGAPINLHVADGAVHGVGRQRSSCGQARARPGRGEGRSLSTHSDGEQLVVVHPQDPSRVHVRQRSPAASHWRNVSWHSRHTSNTAAACPSSRAVDAFHVGNLTCSSPSQPL